MMRCKYTCCKW